MEKFMNRNYQIELDKIIEKIEKEERIPTLLLHSCCAPCSSYVLEYLSRYFAITVFYYNPNIYPEDEYRKRVREQKMLISKMPLKNPVSFIEGAYNTEEFYTVTKGMEEDKEGGQRCLRCYKLRLRRTAELAIENSFDYFTTTLSISPLKNAAKLNEIGEKLAAEYQTVYLPSDFKKRNGYKRSTELSVEYGLYRQNFCGCIFSRRETR